MSTKSKFREQLERREPIRATRPVPSGSPLGAVLTAGEVREPVTVIRTLSDWGIGLRQAHEAMSRLAGGETLPVWFSNAPEPENVTRTLKALGIIAKVRQSPPVDVKAVRSRLGLTQKEFAARFGLDLDTVQNWEQGRNTPDRSTRILLRVIETRPEAVDAIFDS